MPNQAEPVPASPETSAAIALLAQGDGPEAERAKLRLIEDHDPLVAATMRRLYTPAGMREDAEQAARLAMLVALRRYDPARATPFGAYARKDVHRAVAEVVFDASRRRDLQRSDGRDADTRHQPTVASLSRQALPPDVEAVDADDYRLVEERPAIEAVRAFVDGLPLSQRRVVDLVFWEGLTKAEAARQLGISRAAVGQMLSRVYAQGREVLASHAPAA